MVLVFRCRRRRHLLARIGILRVSRTRLSPIGYFQVIDLAPLSVMGFCYYKNPRELAASDSVLDVGANSTARYLEENQPTDEIFTTNSRDFETQTPAGMKPPVSGRAYGIIYDQLGIFSPPRVRLFLSISRISVLVYAHRLRSGNEYVNSTETAPERRRPIGHKLPTGSSADPGASGPPAILVYETNPPRDYTAPLDTRAYALL